MIKIVLIILLLVVVRAAMNLLLPAPYLFYDEQIYYWTADHFSVFGTFHCGFDKFSSVRILYQFLISPFCNFDFQTAFRCIQLFNWILLGSGLLAFALIYKFTINKIPLTPFKKGGINQEIPLPRASAPKISGHSGSETFKKGGIILLLVITAAVLTPAYWVTGQILPDNFMLAAGAWSVFFFFKYLNKHKFSLLIPAVLLFLLSFFAKPHIAIILPAFFVTYCANRFLLKKQPITANEETACPRSFRLPISDFKLLIATAIFCGLVLLTATYILKDNFISKTFLHSAAIPKIPLIKLLTLWTINFVRYLSLPIVVCGIVPPIALLYYFFNNNSSTSRKEKSLIVFSVSFWVVSALVISWFASWRNLSYWQHDIFERYFGLVLPFIAGTGILCIYKLPKISKKSICYLVFSALIISAVITPAIANRTDENGPGTLVFYLIGNEFGKPFVYITVAFLLVFGVIFLRAKILGKIVFSLSILIIFFLVSGFRLANYSKNMFLSGQPYFSVIQKYCNNNDPFILLNVGTPNSWLYSRLRTKNPWVEYDISGISNREMEMQLIGNAMTAGDKLVAAPIWYKLPFSPVASTNGFVFYHVKSGANKNGFIDEIIPEDEFSLTNIYKFSLPFETALVAKVGIEFRTDNVLCDQIGTVTISDNYNLENKKTRFLNGQTGIKKIKIKVKRPSSAEPFCVKICLSTNWPVLRIYTDFPLTQSDVLIRLTHYRKICLTSMYLLI